MDSKIITHPVQAVVLAGGLGTRLGDKTRLLPKPMMDIGGRPFLDYLVRNLQRKGIREVILATGHLSEPIQLFFQDGADHELTIRYAVETTPQGTGGALRGCLPMLDERFFVLNGDTLFDVNLAAMMNTCTTNVMALRPVNDTSRYGRVVLDGERVVGLHEKSTTGRGMINGGVLCLLREHVAGIPEGRSSLETDLLPDLASRGLLAGFESDAFFIDIGVPDSLAAGELSIPRWERKPIAFLDRDGVLNEDIGHLYKIEDFRWTEGARQAVKYLNEKGYYVILITNQAGIAKGKYTEEDFQILTRWMREELAKDGAHLDAVYHCPFHPDAVVPVYRQVSQDRKPAPGMLLRAMSETPHDPSRSFFIGNQPTDCQAASSADITYFDFPGGNLLEFVQNVTA
ncbi:D-glycero-D-manno-heptose 1,7-bisphosphate phosphatase [Prosthecobacter fusiformis]|uniref:D,D-heptose 1,7-bisphosphate phosphatase n=1 Tax=Prosthecobacter fusiformis TaxID=48464 RepID=A0A4R7S1W6_9BACT|nr:HAD-IIIA family hydrolase [Prosthecobacter fusiformis]TDU71418.1 D-glycero-D-manno-heptose 1,7-bisphosphate phosphatase [Prosthecobacter fusiformis]